MGSSHFGPKKLRCGNNKSVPSHFKYCFVSDEGGLLERCFKSGTKRNDFKYDLLPRLAHRRFDWRRGEGGIKNNSSSLTARLPIKLPLNGRSFPPPNLITPTTSQTSSLLSDVKANRSGPMVGRLQFLSTWDRLSVRRLWCVCSTDAGWLWCAQALSAGTSLVPTLSKWLP